MTTNTIIFALLRVFCFFQDSRVFSTLQLNFFSTLVLGTQYAAGVTYIIINLVEYPTGAAYDA